MRQAITTSLVDGIRQAWHDDAGLGLYAGLLDLYLENGTVIVAGEVPTIGVKKRAFFGANAFCRRVVDRITVAPRQPMDDSEIEEMLIDAYAGEPLFSDIHVRLRQERLHPVSDGSAAIGVSVERGIVHLAGSVPGLDCKRLAGVMAWWIPGSRDVVNGLSVPPASTFDSLAEAVRQVLEKDPWVEAAPVRVGARDSDVTLAGTVTSPDQRRLSELDAWYVFGVDNVINRMTVRR